MATITESSIKRVSLNLHQLIQITMDNTRALEKSTLKLRMKIKADLDALTKDLSQKDQLRLKSMIVNAIQENTHAAGSTAKIGTPDGPCFGEGSHGIDYEEGGVYGGVCGIGSIHGLTGGGVFGGFHY